MINIIYSKQRFAEKPIDKGVISGLQKPYNYVFDGVDSIEEVAALIGEGRAWRAGLYESGTDSFKKANVKAAQIIALDFDTCQYEPEVVVQYAESIGINPSAWYYSYSQGKKSGYNFRILWVLEAPIKHIQYETIYLEMLNQFKQYGPDVSTKDASRLWFGTARGVNVLSSTPVKIAAIGWLGVCDKIRQGQPTQKAKKAIKACESSFFEDSEADYEPIYIPQKFDWKAALRFKCWLWDRWENGIYLNYNQRLTLFSNLKYIKYGNNNITVIKDILDIFYKYANVYEGHTCNEEQIRGMFLNTTLHAVGIVKVAGEENPITVKEYLSRTPHEALNTLDKISLEELDTMLQEKMPQLLDNKGIVYIKSQTASGKTHYVIQWLLRQDLKNKKIIYSAPRYTNMDEFKERFIKAYNEVNANGQSAERIVKTIPRGNYTQTDLFLMEMGFPAATRQDERFKMIQEMVSNDSKGLFIATHQCIAHLRTCPADCIIIDENIEDALLTKTKLDLGGLASIIPFVESKEKQDALTNYLNEIKDKEQGEIVEIEVLRQALINFDWDGYFSIDKPMAGIAKILEPHKEPPMITKVKGKGGKKQSAIKLTTKSTLINDAIEQHTPIKLLSATPKPVLLSRIYNTDRIEVYQFPLARNEGEIIQLMGITGAKGNECSRVADIIKYVKANVPEEEQKQAYVLSFKDAIPLWEQEGFKIPEYNGTKLHIANNAGLDLLKGEIVIVGGKYDMSDEEYLDYYYDIHPDSKTQPKRVMKKITIAGRMTTLYLWDDKTLQDLQIETIKLHLEQSAGRARALREKGAKVYLICDFPIEDADVFRED